MKKIWNVFKKHWITVWLIVALAALGTLLVLAAYTEVSSVKRVVSTQSSPAVMFSSNCMRKVLSMRRLSSNTYTVTVCNFDQDKPTIYNLSEIEYTLYAEIQVKIGDAYYTMSQLRASDDLALAGKYDEYKTKIINKYFITKTYDDANPSTLITPASNLDFNENNNFTVTFSPETLAAQRSSVDRFKIEIDGSTINNEDPDIFVYVKATATETATDNSLGSIEAMLYGAKAIDETATWTGRMLETSCADVDYDFYNYVISGSGVGTVDLLWDPNKFEINPFFFTDSDNHFANNVNTPVTVLSTDEKYGQGSQTDYTGWSKVTISVNSITKNRYELQLYKTQTGMSYTGQQNSADKFIACFFND